MENNKPDTSSPKVDIIMGSISDLPIMKQSAEFLQQLGISYQIDIVSAHRTPRK